MGNIIGGCSAANQPPHIKTKNGEIIMTEQEIFDKVKEILVDQFDLEDNEVELTTDLTNDIDADSLDLFEVLNRVEDDFDIKLSVAEGIKTVQDLVDQIKAAQA
jgi:acyl carrier protein